MGACDINSVQAFKGTFTHEEMEGEDNAVASFCFKPGIIGTFVASTSIVPPFPRRIEVHVSKGTALLDESTFRLLKTEKDLQSLMQNILLIQSPNQSSHINLEFRGN